MKKPTPGTILLHAVLIAGAAITMMPLVWMVAASFMSAGEANSLPPRLLPRDPTLENYTALVTRLDMVRNFANSAIVTVLATVLSVIGISDAQTALIIGFILPFDRILDMMRTVVNVSGDAAVAVAVAKWEGELDETVFRATATV